MDLQKQLLREHSKVNCQKIVNFIGKSPKKFAQLVSIYLEGPYRITQRAAWPLTYCAERNPELVSPHFKKILDFVGRPDVHVAVRRNTLRMFQFIDIPKKFHGRVVEIGFNLLQAKSEPVAVQVFAMTTLARLVYDKPELAHELCLIIEDRLPFATAGFKSRGKKILRELRSVISSK